MRPKTEKKNLGDEKVDDGVEVEEQGEANGGAGQRVARKGGEKTPVPYWRDADLRFMVD